MNGKQLKRWCMIQKWHILSMPSKKRPYLAHNNIMTEKMIISRYAKAFIKNYRVVVERYPIANAARIRKIYHSQTHTKFERAIKKPVLMIFRVNNVPLKW